jgi:exopolysaccharide biosynthesis polyprenyl glycosylphosphotransferase
MRREGLVVARTQPHTELDGFERALERSPGFVDRQDVLGDLVSLRTVPDLPAGNGSSQRFKDWSHRYVRRLELTDAIVGAVAIAIPAMFSFNLRTGSLSGYLLPLVLTGAVLWPVVILMLRGYQRSTIGVGSDEPRAVLRAGVIIVAAAAFPAGWFQNQTLLTLLVIAIPLAMLLSLTARLVARKVLHRRQRDGRNVRSVVIAGSASAAAELQERLAREPHCGMKVIGVCVPRHERVQALDAGLTVLGDLDEVAQVVTTSPADAVAVTSDDATRYNYLRRLSWSLEGTGVEMLVDPGLVEVAGPRMHIRPLLGFPLLHVEEPHFTGWRRALKRGADVVITSVGVLVISPILLAIALAIKFQDGGPILFKQHRVGRGGELFSMYKFRSMVVDAEARKAALMARNEGKGGLFKLNDDPRITRLGRFLRDYSLDELPQLINVLNGSMSLVGPRPHLAEELAHMPHASRRSLVTPGLTGLWQVSGRSDLEGDDAMRLDLRYVENWSITMDLLILWKTGAAVLAKRGAR